jgi:hypothetical protein
MPGRRCLLAGLPGLLLVLTACSSAPPPPVLDALKARPEKIPVILVPGITGSVLQDAETGKVLWGTGVRLLAPRDRGYSLALPIAPVAPVPPILEDASRGAKDAVTAPGVLHHIGLLGLAKKPIYGPIFDLMEANGYQVGDLAAPRPGDTFFAFPYDWRRDNTLSAARLEQALQRLRAVRGGGPLTVHLICQSNGGHICRYLAKYGGASLEEAEAGRAAPPEGIEIEKILLIGTANGGSLRILRELHRGRQYLPPFGRKWAPETLFTFPALFQDLPVYNPEPFLGPDGETVDADLFNPEDWVKYGWSVFSAKVEKRLQRQKLRPLFGTPEERRAYLERMLDRGRRFHQLLLADGAGAEEIRHYLIQNNRAATPDRALLLPPEAGREAWQTCFFGDRHPAGEPFLSERTTAPGDGHATEASQLWLSPAARLGIAQPPVYVDGGHFELLLEPPSLKAILRFLEDD